MRESKIDKSFFDTYTDEQVADMVIDWRSSPKEEKEKAIRHEQMIPVLVLISMASGRLNDSTKEELIGTIRQLRDFMQEVEEINVKIE